MKTKIIFLAITFISVTNFTNTYAQTQKRIVENAMKDVSLVPSKDAKTKDNQKPCDIVNKSPCRTISVRIEESELVNNFLQKKIISIEKIGPKEQKFVGYAGCDANVVYEKCIGYKISVAYYEDGGGTVSVQDDKSQLVKSIDDKGITAK